MPASRLASDLRLYRRLLGYVLPYKRVFAAALLGLLLMSAGDGAMVWLLKPIIDDGFVARDESVVAFMAGLIVLFGFVRAAGGAMDEYCMTWVARRVIQDLRRQMFARLLHAPVSFHDHNASGQLTARLVHHVEQVAAASTSAIRILVRDASMVLFLFGAMFYHNWKLSSVLVLLIPPSYFIFKLSSGKFRALSLRVQDSVATISHIAGEAFKGHRIIKSFHAFALQNRAFEEANNRNRQLLIKSSVVSAITVALVVFLSGVAVAGVLLLTYRQNVSLGTLSFYLLAIIRLTKPIRSLARINLVIQGGLAGAQSVFATIDQTQEIDDGKTDLGRARGEVRFNQVSFAYPKNDAAVLSEVDLHIRAGQCVAVVGESGAGKSTLASLLLRFYSPSAGQIVIDDKPLHEITLQSLRANIAVVSQEIALFDDSIARNIAFADDAIDHARLMHAAEAAQVVSFAEKLPRGLDTIVGEQGIRLSGGQRQRIAIARALYKDAPILLLDEATSSLDSQVEQRIRRAIDALIKNRTSLIIAHRLSTIENADAIVVLSGGRIVERGTHAELLAYAGEYARLHSAQHHASAAKPRA